MAVNSSGSNANSATNRDGLAAGVQPPVTTTTTTTSPKTTTTTSTNTKQRPPPLPSSGTGTGVDPLKITNHSSSSPNTSSSFPKGHGPLPRINKADISGPSPLILPPRTSTLPLPSPPSTNIHTNPGLNQLLNSGGSGRRPFDPTFLDISASQVDMDEPSSAAHQSGDTGGLVGNKPPRRTLTLSQYQSLLQAFSVFQKQVRSLALSSDHLVRGLEELGDCAQVTTDSSLGSLIDCLRLLSNTHTTWSQTIEREVERPYAKNIAVIQSNVASRLKSNELTVQTLSKHLQNEEMASYKSAKRGMGKVTADLNALTSSLSTRMKLTQEIQRIQQENVRLPDALAHEHMDYILSRLDKALKSQLVAYDLIAEGLKKLDLGLNVEDDSQIIDSPTDA